MILQQRLIKIIDAYGGHQKLNRKLKQLRQLVPAQDRMRVTNMYLYYDSLYHGVIDCEYMIDTFYDEGVATLKLLKRLKQQYKYNSAISLGIDLLKTAMAHKTVLYKVS